MMSQHGYQPTFQSSLQSEGTMDLFIETLTGTAFEMTVSPFDTVMSIKSKIQRVEGIPVAHQHLLFNSKELDNSSCLIDYSIHNGATLKLVLSMRGGPISTRRLPTGDEIAWRELRDLVDTSREDVFDHLPPGCRMTVLVFREGDQVNLYRVIENDDGTYSPLSESLSGSAIRNLFAEEDPEEAAKKVQENSVTMEKMQELKYKMEKLALQKKPKKPPPPSPHISSSKHCLLHHRKGTSRPRQPTTSKSPEPVDIPKPKNSTNLQLPPIKGNLRLPSATGYLTTSSLLQPKTAITMPPIRSTDAEIRIPVKHHSEDSRIPIKQRTEDFNFFSSTHSFHLDKKETKKSGREKESSISSTRQLSSSYQPSIMEVFSDKNPKRDYLCVRESARNLPSAKAKHSRDSESVSGMTSPNIAIVEEETDPSVEKPDFPPPPSPIPVPFKETTAFTLSQLPRERVSTSVSSGHNRLRVSRLILDEDDRPKTSPDKLMPHQKAGPGLCDLLAPPRHIHCSSSRLDTAAAASDSFLRTASPRTSPVMLVLPPERVESLEPAVMRLPRRRVTSGNQAAVVLPPPPAMKKQASVRTRCSLCKKRLNITNVYTCRCEKLFCSAHRYSELHACTFDYKSQGRKLLQQANPLVTAPKLPKI